MGGAFFEGEGSEKVPAQSEGWDLRVQQRTKDTQPPREKSGKKHRASAKGKDKASSKVVEPKVVIETSVETVSGDGDADNEGSSFQCFSVNDQFMLFEMASKVRL